MRACCIIIGVILLMSCAASKAFRVKPSLINDGSQERYSREPFRQPYFSRFQNGGKQLLFIATEHEVGLSSDTFRLIQRQVSTFRPQIILVEGIAETDAQNFQLIDRIIDCRKDCFQRCGEDMFAVSVALLSDIPYAGIEVSDVEVKKALLASGFSETDIIGFYVLREIPYYRRSGETVVYKDEKAFLHHVKVRQERLKMDIAFDLDAFRRWYLKRTGRKLVVDTFDHNDISPSHSSGFLHAMSRTIGRIRDRHIADTIAAALNAHDRVMVVCGQGHLVTLRPVLEDMLGKPIAKGK